jgi:hypothetical protein
VLDAGEKLVGNQDLLAPPWRLMKGAFNEFTAATSTAAVAKCFRGWLPSADSSWATSSSTWVAVRDE